MVLGVVMEERFVHADGRFFSPRGFNRTFWERYLETFERVRVMARVEDSAVRPHDLEPIMFPGLEFAAMPDYRGVGSLLRKATPVARALQAAMTDIDALLVRLPGPLGLTAASLRPRHRPFAVELVGDIDGVLRSGVGGVAAPILRAAAVPLTRRACRQADAISYVTERTLQARYPARADAICSSYSSIELPDAAFAAAPRRHAAEPAVVRLLSVGSLEAPYKGMDTLIHCVAILRRRGRNVELAIAGGGRLGDKLRRTIRRLDIEDAVHILGRVARDRVFEEMRQCRIYVQASRTEGLPRSIIEAAATAAPVVATAVGGVPELIDTQFLVPPGDAEAMADRLDGCMRFPQTLDLMSKTNWQRAQGFRREPLAARRKAFYGQIAELARQS